MPRWIALILLIFIFWPPPVTGAPQMSGTNQDLEAPLEYAYGSVESISSQELVLSEYDFDREETVKMRYRIGSVEEFQEAQPVPKISVGDDIEVYYKLQNGEKIAMTIVKEAPAGQNSGSITDADDDPEDEGAMSTPGPKEGK